MAKTGTVTFAAGETAKTVAVQVNGDTRKAMRHDPNPNPNPSSR